ncbi:two-component regulator propeller domain-containing protein [Bacteroidota bacterium]
MNPVKTIAAVLGIFILCGLRTGFCQLHQFEHYAVEDGVSQSAINCIFQDSEGFMWFGTQNGLNKFDGYGYENYYNNPSDTNSISNSWIFDITEDEDGYLWIATKGGLNKFDKTTGRFLRINLPVDYPGIYNSFVYGICSDDSNIYISRPPKLSILNYRTGAYESYENSFEPDGALYDLGFPLLKGSDGLLWIGSLDGLASFDMKEKKFRNFSHRGSEQIIWTSGPINALSEDRHKNILIGSDNGFYILNPESFQITPYLQDTGRPGSISRNNITSVVQDYSGAIWLGTAGGGLYKMKINEETGSAEFIHFGSGPDNINYINHDFIQSLWEDNSNNLWIGGLAGIDKTDLKKKNIRTYQKSDNPNSVALLDNIIASVYQDKQGRIWIGTWGKGLTILDRNTSEVINYTSEHPRKWNIPENHVHVIFEDSKGRIWLGTRNGVCIFDDNAGLFVPAGDYFNAPGFDYFINNRVYCMIEDSRGEIWIGTGNGIFILNTLTKSSKVIRAGGATQPSIGSNLVYSLLEDSDHDIWITTSNGLNRYAPSENRIYQYTNDPGSSNSISDNYSIALCDDEEGNIWVGTSTGVNIFNKSDAVFTRYYTSHGLPGNIIYDIIKDGNGNLWFSTGSGLAMKNPDEESPETFLIVDELRGKEFNIKAVFKASDGEMFFGGIDGLVSFYPDSLEDNSFIPPVRITSLEKENSGMRERVNIYNDEILLSYKDYSFTIEFAALEFTNPAKNRYSYQMEGISDRWVDIGTRRFVHFTNLSPGKYSFTVKGSNNDGVWNTTGASIRIIILPPWWRSNYAYAGYVVLLILIIIGVVKARERNLVREKKVLEDRITERTAQIFEQKGRLEESEAKMKSTVSSIDDLVFVLDQDGIFQEFYNLGKHKSLYRESESFIHKHYEKIGYPETYVQQLTKAFEELKRKDSVQEFDYCLGGTSDLCWFNAKVSPRRNLKGELTGIIIVARDITERKESEEQLKELNATKDRFFSILAHDLKNPFSSLHSMSELAIENYQSLEEDEKLKMLQNIHKSAELIYNLLENLLTWSNTQRGRIDYSPDRFNLSKIIEVNMNLHQIPAEKKGLVLSANVKDELPAYGDREMINTVVRNLINNAIKFSNRGDAVNAGVKVKGEMFEVTISDQGTGISAENVAKLFRVDEKYKSTGTAGETGTGLGLVLCKEFVEKNGGEIRVKSKEGSGSEFVFTIPRYNPDTPA